MLKINRIKISEIYIDEKPRNYQKQKAAGGGLIANIACCGAGYYVSPLNQKKRREGQLKAQDTLGKVADQEYRTTSDSQTTNQLSDLRRRKSFQVHLQAQSEINKLLEGR